MCSRNPNTQMRSLAGSVTGFLKSVDRSAGLASRRVYQRFLPESQMRRNVCRRGSFAVEEL